MFGDLLTRHPTAFAHTVLTASLLVDGFTEVVVTGDRPDLVDVVRSGWLPGVGAGLGRADRRRPCGQDRDEHRVYVCRNYACQLPADDADTLLAQLRSSAGPAELR